MPGTLIPSWYQPLEPGCDDLTVVSVIWGVSLGLSALGLVRVAEQTFRQYRRKREVTSYMAFIWLELMSSTIFGGLAWGFIRGNISPSFEFFFGIVVLWIVQVHCIIQIIINRIALLAVSPVTVRRLRWGVFALVVLINIAVAVIWIPSCLQISERWISINKVWDRLQKAIFLIIYAALNCYFVHLVRSSLVEYGLTKYVVLYRFNIAMIAVSVSMDVLIIGMMSLSNSFVYAIFHPLAYLVKLHIELSMADLIARIVKATGNYSDCDCGCHADNPYLFGQDLNDDEEGHSTPAGLGRRRARRYSHHASLRRTLQRFSFSEAQKGPIGSRRPRDSWGMRMPPPVVRRREERACSWAGPHSGRKDSGFWLSSMSSTNRSGSNNNGHQD